MPPEPHVVLPEQVVPVLPLLLPVLPPLLLVLPQVPPELLPLPLLLEAHWLEQLCVSQVPIAEAAEVHVDVT